MVAFNLNPSKVTNSPSNELKFRCEISRFTSESRRIVMNMSVFQSKIYAPPLRKTTRDISSEVIPRALSNEELNDWLIVEKKSIESPMPVYAHQNSVGGIALISIYDCRIDSCLRASKSIARNSFSCYRSFSCFAFTYV